MYVFPLSTKGPNLYHHHRHDYYCLIMIITTMLKTSKKKKILVGSESFMETIMALSSYAFSL